MIAMDCNAYKINTHESIFIQISNLNTLLKNREGIALPYNRSPIDECRKNDRSKKITIWQTPCSLLQIRITHGC